MVLSENRASTSRCTQVWRSVRAGTGNRYSGLAKVTGRTRRDHGKIDRPKRRFGAQEQSPMRTPGSGEPQIIDDRLPDRGRGRKGRVASCLAIGNPQSFALSVDQVQRQCGDFSGTQSVQADGNCAIETSPVPDSENDVVDTDTVLELYSGDPMTLLGQDDDGNGEEPLYSRLIGNLPANTTDYVRVMSYWEDEGDFQISVTPLEQSAARCLGNHVEKSVNSA